jgi:2-dehydropantoate 2-reductase
MNIQTVAIIGQGALGILFGKLLTDALGKENVSFIANPTRIQRYKMNGIYCNGEKCDFSYLSSEEPRNPVDLLIFAVKFPALEGAIREAAPFVGSKTILLSLLNGISSEEIIGNALGDDKVVYCVAQGMDATREDNKLIYSNAGYLIIGEKDNRISPKITALTELFKKTGIEYRIASDVQKVMWNKFMLNVGINQVTTAYETNYGGAQVDGEPRTTMLAAMREVQQIASAKGIELTNQDIDDWMKVIEPFNPELMPSMRQDSLAGRPTEVELFSGTVLKMADQLGIDVPVNRFLYHKIKEIESRYHKEI